MKRDDSIILDVRTEDELKFIGRVDENQNNYTTVNIESHSAPNMSTNEDFLSICNEYIKDKDSQIFCICRSGKRSAFAANKLEQDGYNYVYNIRDGFEGNSNNLGWKLSNLPWK